MRKWKRAFSLFPSQVSASRVNDRHGWQVQCNEPLQFMSLHIPEENRWSTISYKHTPTHKSYVLFFFLTRYLLLLTRSVDILELSEQRELLKFHHHTLRLYSAICALGNNRVAHALCSHVDESQLLQAIENKYMPGNWQQALGKAFQEIRVLHSPGGLISDWIGVTSLEQCPFEKTKNRKS